MIRQLATALLDVIYPPICHGCGAPLVEGEKYLCLQCIAGLPRTFHALSPADNQMTRRFAGIFPFDYAASWLFYTHDSLVASLIQDFKYRAFPDMASHLGMLMGNELMQSGYFSGIDMIIPMGQHWTRRLKRGYNQTELLAAGLSQATSIPYATPLYASRPHSTQTRVSLERRLTNPRNVYKVTHPQRFAGLHLLLIDDVCTTGATLTSAAEILLKTIPDIRLSMLTIASTV